MMKNYKYLLQALSLCVLLATMSPAQAVKLGELRLYSGMQEPLRAEIDLLGVGLADINNVIVDLANRQAFAQAGMERRHFITNLNFQILQQGASLVVRVTTDVPIQEPYLAFLLEARSSKDKSVDIREYTALFDLDYLSSEKSAKNKVTAITDTNQGSSDAVDAAGNSSAAESATAEPIVSSEDAAAGAQAELYPSFEQQADSLTVAHQHTATSLQQRTANVLQASEPAAAPSSLKQRLLDLQSHSFAGLFWLGLVAALFALFYGLYLLLQRLVLQGFGQQKKMRIDPQFMDQHQFDRVGEVRTIKLADRARDAAEDKYSADIETTSYADDDYRFNEDLDVLQVNSATQEFDVEDFLKAKGHSEFELNKGIINVTSMLGSDSDFVVDEHELESLQSDPVLQAHSLQQEYAIGSRDAQPIDDTANTGYRAHMENQNTHKELDPRRGIANDVDNGALLSTTAQQSRQLVKEQDVDQLLDALEFDDAPGYLRPLATAQARTPNDTFLNDLLEVSEEVEVTAVQPITAVQQPMQDVNLVKTVDAQPTLQVQQAELRVTQVPDAVQEPVVKSEVELPRQAFAQTAGAIGLQEPIVKEKAKLAGRKIDFKRSNLDFDGIEAESLLAKNQAGASKNIPQAIVAPIAKISNFDFYVEMPPFPKGVLQKHKAASKSQKTSALKTERWDFVQSPLEESDSVGAVPSSFKNTIAVDADRQGFSIAEHGRYKTLEKIEQKSDRHVFKDAVDKELQTFVEISPQQNLSAPASELVDSPTLRPQLQEKLELADVDAVESIDSVDRTLDKPLPSSVLVEPMATQSLFDDTAQQATVIEQRTEQGASLATQSQPLSSIAEDDVKTETADAAGDSTFARRSGDIQTARKKYSAAAGPILNEALMNSAPVSADHFSLELDLAHVQEEPVASAANEELNLPSLDFVVEPAQKQSEQIVVSVEEELEEIIVEENHPEQVAAAAESQLQDQSSLKLDLARMYINLGDIDSAKEMLDEVLKEGTSAQQNTAQKLLLQL